MEIGTQAVKLASTFGTDDYPNELNSLGWYYYHLGDYETALKVIRKSLKIFKSDFPDKLEIAYPYGNLGLLKTRTEDYDSAIYYSQNAASIFIKYDNFSDIDTQSTTD